MAPLLEEKRQKEAALLGVLALQPAEVTITISCCNTQGAAFDKAAELPFCRLKHPAL